MASGTATNSMFCRHCGYNLHGLPENRCSECGRPFDPTNPKTFLNHPHSFSRRRWAKRILVAVVPLLLLGSLAGFSLWWPWHREQAAVRMVQRCGGSVNTITVGPPWLLKLLGQRGGFLLERVDRVQIYGPRVRDADLAALEGLSQLQDLTLSGTKVTDAGLEHLKNLKELQTLLLNGTQVTDAGLEHLKNLKRLQFVCFAGAHVTDAGAAALKKALPGCDIIR